VPGSFAELHGLVTPLALVAGALGFFVVLLGWDARLRAQARSADP